MNNTSIYKSSANSAFDGLQNSTLNDTNANQCKYTILIAEDEILNFQILQMLLEIILKSNCNILHAFNGKEAIEICRNNKNIDLVLMDVKMPLITGIDATKEIKKLYPDMPVIAQTAYISKEYNNMATDKLFNDFLSKPIEKDKLENALSRFLH